MSGLFTGLGTEDFTGVEGVAAYDPASHRSTLESLYRYARGAVTAPFDIADPVHRAGLDEVRRASEESQRLLYSTNWHRNRLEQVYDETIDQVKRATGVRLDNPMYVTGLTPLDTVIEGDTVWTTGEAGVALQTLDRHQKFLDDFDAVKRQFPDALAAVEPPRDPDSLGNAAARLTETRLARAEDADLNPVLALGAALAGGIEGSRKDPLFIASMALGGGPATGRTLFGRLFTGAAKAGAVNAALDAVAEPFIQQGRAAAGLDSGLDHALAGILSAFVVGAGVAGGGHLIGEMAGKLGRSGLSEADYRVLERNGLFVPEADREALRGAAAAARADGDMARAVPLDVPDHAAPVVLAEALAVVDDPARPLPLVDPPVPPGLTDRAARAAIAGSADMAEALDRLAGAHRDYLARVDALARAMSPDVHAAAAALDMDIAGARGRIAELDALKARIAAAPPPVGAARIDGIGQDVARLQAELAAFTGKRRTSPPAKALRGRIDELQAEAGRLRSAAETVTGGEAKRIDGDVAALRLRLVEKLSDRGRLGPEIGRSRALAEQRVTAEAPSPLISAFASDDPATRDLGRIASLDRDLVDRVVRGEVDPRHAVVVSATVRDPALRASALQALAEARPPTILAARALVSDHVAAARAVDAETARTGGRPFGPQIAATADTFAAAIDQARALGTGEIVGALHHPVLGDISIPLGNDAIGVLHIERQHPEISLIDLPAIVERSTIIRQTESRVSLLDGKTEVAVKLSYVDDVTGGVYHRKWVVTAFDQDGRSRFRPEENGRRPETHPSQASVSQAGTVDFPPPAKPDIDPAPANGKTVSDDGSVGRKGPVSIADTVPIEDASGIRFIPRDALDQVAARERFLGDLVQACKV